MPAAGEAVLRTIIALVQSLEMAPGTEPPNAASRIVCLFVSVLAASFAGVFAWVGTEAIATRQYKLEWREGSSLTIGPVVAIDQLRQQGVEIYQGAAAIRMGIGFIATGLLFAFGSACIVVTGVLGWQPAGKFGLIGQAAAIVCLLCLIVLSACFFPPWQLWALWFWGEVLLWMTYFFAVPWAPTLLPWGKRLAVAVLILAIVTGTFSIPGAFVGLAGGLILSLFGMSLVTALWPPLAAHLEQLTSAQRAIPG